MTPTTTAERAVDLVRGALATLAALVERDGTPAVAQHIADAGIRCDARDKCDPGTCAVARYVYAQTGYPVTISTRGGCKVWADPIDEFDGRAPLGTIDTPTPVAKLFEQFDAGRFDGILLRHAETPADPA